MTSVDTEVDANNVPWSLNPNFLFSILSELDMDRHGNITVSTTVWNMGLSGVFYRVSLHIEFVVVHFQKDSNNKVTVNKYCKQRFLNGWLVLCRPLVDLFISSPTCTYEGSSPAPLLSCALKYLKNVGKLPSTVSGIVFALCPKGSLWIIQESSCTFSMHGAHCNMIWTEKEIYYTLRSCRWVVFSIETGLSPILPPYSC